MFSVDLILVLLIPINYNFNLSAINRNIYISFYDVSTYHGKNSMDIIKTCIGKV